MVFTLHYFIRHHPELLERRLRQRKRRSGSGFLSRSWHRYILPRLSSPASTIALGWSNVPASLVVIADALVLSGYIMIFFVFKQNAYASRIIEVTEGQKVISTGLYGCIRHPMYLGSIIMYLPIPIALGSYWGLTPCRFSFPALCSGY
jgi:protein-S-isoprenylcysteine O-methyltransferase Ste14